MTSLNKDLLEKHKGIAVPIIRRYEGGGEPEVRIALISNCGTLAKGDFLWHLGSSAATDPQRLPLWNGDFEAPPGNLTAVFFENGGLSAKCCALSLLRRVVNEACDNGKTPVTVQSYCSASWETYGPNNRSIGLNKASFTLDGSDDTAFIAWFDGNSKTPMCPLPTDLVNMKDSAMAALLAVTDFDLQTEEEVLGPQAEMIKTALEARAKAVNCKKVEIKQWRKEGTVGYDEIGRAASTEDVDEDEESEEKKPKKRKARHDDSHPVAGTPGAPPSPPFVPLPAFSFPSLPGLPQASIDGFTLAEIKGQLAELKQNTAIIADLREQVEFEKLRAEKYRAAAESLAHAFAPLESSKIDKFTVKRCILAYFAGGRMENKSDIDLFLEIPVTKRENAVRMLDLCMEQREVTSFLSEVMGKELGAKALRTSNHVHRAVMSILPFSVLKSVAAMDTVAKKVAETWEKNDLSGAVKVLSDALETVKDGSQAVTLVTMMHTVLLSD